eukprot:953839_1
MQCAFFWGSTSESWGNWPNVSSPHRLMAPGSTHLFGTNTDADGRACFSDFCDQFWRELRRRLREAPEDSDDRFLKREIQVSFQKNGIVYDYMFNKAAKRWDGWMSTIPKLGVPSYIVRSSWFLENAIFIGATGTGKSVIVQKKTFSELSRDKFDFVQCSDVGETYAIYYRFENVQGRAAWK